MDIKKEISLCNNVCVDLPPENKLRLELDSAMGELIVLLDELLT